MRPGRRHLGDLRGVYNTVPVTFGAKVTGTQGAKVTGTQGAKVTGTRGAKVTGTRGAKVTGTQEVREETEYGKNLFKQ